MSGLLRKFDEENDRITRESERLAAQQAMAFSEQQQERDQLEQLEIEARAKLDPVFQELAQLLGITKTQVTFDGNAAPIKPNIQILSPVVSSRVITFEASKKKPEKGYVWISCRLPKLIRFTRKQDADYGSEPHYDPLFESWTGGSSPYFRIIEEIHAQLFSFQIKIFADGITDELQSYKVNRQIDHGGRKSPTYEIEYLYRPVRIPFPVTDPRWITEIVSILAKKAAHNGFIPLSVSREETTHLDMDKLHEELQAIKSKLQERDYQSEVLDFLSGASLGRMENKSASR